MTDESIPFPVLSVSAAAARLGVAPSTLRTWDRRYSLGPSEHAAGSHRRYTRQDVARLMIMRRLTLEGIAPADAAKIALATAVDAQAPNLLDSEEFKDLRGVEFTIQVGSTPDDSEADAAADTQPDNFLGFTREQLAARELDGQICSALTSAARRFDESGLTRAIDALSSARGIAESWAQVIKHSVVELFFNAEAVLPGMEPLGTVHHALTGVLRRASEGQLQRAAHAEDEAASRNSLKGEEGNGNVLVCSDGDELSNMSAQVLAAALNQSGAPALVLAGQVRDTILRRVLRDTAPAAVVAVGWQEPSGQMLDAVRACLDEFSEVPVLLNGPGWSRNVPAGAYRVRSFIGALHEAQAYLP